MGVVLAFPITNLIRVRSRRKEWRASGGHRRIRHVRRVRTPRTEAGVTKEKRRG